MSALAFSHSASASQPKALVYRGPAACDGCPEAVAQLLQSSPSKFDVVYAGPNETVQITPETLSQVDVYAQPGGDDLDKTWPMMEPYADAIRNFVSNGGRYLGFCLGAYMAGHSPGFGFLPEDDDTDAEQGRPGAQVNTEDDTVIQVDWHFSTGSEAGQTQKGRWMYFQDGAVIELSNNSTVQILGRYSSNGDVAATLSTYGKGWVGLTGPHPEATADWYSSYGIKNPDGIRFDIGYDFVEATASSKTDNSTAATKPANQTAASISQATPLISPGSYASLVAMGVFAAYVAWLYIC